MIIEYIERKFIKQNKNNLPNNSLYRSNCIRVQSSNNNIKSTDIDITKDNTMRERTRYAYISSFVGIFANLTLVIIEFIIGLLSGSSAIMSDSLHNISDVTSSIISLISFKLGSFPKSKKYPFALGRIEYLASFLLAEIIIFIGLLFFKNSITHIIYPEQLSFNYIYVLIMSIGIIIKVWLSHYFKIIGNKINSSLLLASSIDAKNDCWILVGVISSLLIFKITGINIDAYVGVIISLFIIRSGYYICKDSVNSLIGKATDEEVSNKLIAYIKTYPIVKEVFGLETHDYGINNQMVSLHIRINDDSLSIKEIDKIIDEIEENIDKEFSISICIEIEPSEDDN